MAIYDTVDLFAQALVSLGIFFGDQFPQASLFFRGGFTPGKIGLDRLIENFPDGFTLESRPSFQRPVDILIQISNRGIHVFNVTQMFFWCKSCSSLAPLHFEPLFWEERFDWARRCPRAPPGAPKYLIPLVFRKREGGKGFQIGGVQSSPFNFSRI